MDTMNAMCWTWFIVLTYIALNYYFDWRNGRGA